MPNLLNAYEHVEKDALATQLAILETVSFSAAMKPAAQKVGKVGAKVLNWAARLAGKNRIVTEPIVVELPDQVVRNFESLKSCPRNELWSRFRSGLEMRIGEGSCSSDLRLSVAIIREAAAGLDVDEELTPAQQAVAVAQRYWEKCLVGIQETLQKQDASQAKATVHSIDERLQAMSPQERLELQKTLKLDKLTADAVRTAFMSAGGPLAGMAVMQMAGFGAYLALTTIIHAVFTTMLGLTLPFAFYTSATSVLSFLTGPFAIVIAAVGFGIGKHFAERRINRQLFAMIVWTGVVHAQRPLVASDDELPSHALLGCASTDDSDLHQLTLEKTLAEFSLSSQRSQLKELEKRHEREKSTLARVAARRSEAVRKLSLLSGRVQTDTSVTETESARIKAELNAAQIEIDRLSSSCASLHAERDRQIERVASLQAASQKKSEAEENKIESRRAEIAKLWEIHFSNFSFEAAALRWTAKLPFPDRLEVERVLSELRSAKDPGALSRSKMQSLDNEHHLGFKLKSGVAARIFYKCQNGRVLVSGLCKKSEMKAYEAAHR